jgi:hypothetical protein
MSNSGCKKHILTATTLLGGTALTTILTATAAQAVCVPSLTPTLVTVNCVGTTNLPAPITFTTPASVNVVLGSDGNPASVSYTTTSAAAVALTQTGPAGTSSSVDTGNVGTPSSITGATSGISITSTGGGSILIGQSSAGGNGLNANVTGNNGRGISATAALTGPVNITTAAGASVTGTQEGILASVASGPANVIFNGNVTTLIPGSYYDVVVTSTGGGAITVGGAGNSTAGGISASGSGTTGGITIQGTGNTTDVLNGPGILARLTNAANNSAIQINRSGSIYGYFDGIVASTAGSGPVTISTSNSVTGAGGYGINTSAAGGITTINIGAASSVTGTSGSIKVASSGAGSATVNNFGSINGLITATGPLTINNAGSFNIASGSATNVQTATTYNGQGGNLTVGVKASTQTADLLRVTNLSGNSTLTVVPLGGTTFISNPITFITANNVAAGTTVTSTNSGIINYSIGTRPDAAIPGATDYTVFSTLNTSKTSATPAGIDAIITALNTGFFQNASAFVAEPPDPANNQINGGPWIRVSGGRNDVSGVATAANPGGATLAPTKVRTDFNGFQTGIDLGVANVEGTGWNTHIGVTAGQVMLGVNDLVSTSVSSQTQVPFVGIYGALTGHNFFADLQVREDFYNMKLNNPAANLGGTNLAGKAFAINASAGYRFDLPGSWFIEPSGAFMYSRLRVDSLPLGLGGGTTAYLVFNSFQSAIGRVGLRAGTTYVLDSFQLALQPFVTASVWREFAGNTNTNFTTGTAIVPLSVTRVGTFGQVGIGVSGQVLKTGLIGFIRGDYRFGDHINGYALVGGLRYQF